MGEDDRVGEVGKSDRWAHRGSLQYLARAVGSCAASSTAAMTVAVMEIGQLERPQWEPSSRTAPTTGPPHRGRPHGARPKGTTLFRRMPARPAPRRVVAVRGSVPRSSRANGPLVRSRYESPDAVTPDQRRGLDSPLRTGGFYVSGPPTGAHDDSPPFPPCAAGTDLGWLVLETPASCAGADVTHRDHCGNGSPVSLPRPLFASLT